MNKVEQWPPPNWEEVVVTWDKILGPPEYPIREILNWVDSTPGGHYHLHGYRSTEGFAFRFEDSADATHFRIKWL